MSQTGETIVDTKKALEKSVRMWETLPVNAAEKISAYVRQGGKEDHNFCFCCDYAKKKSNSSFYSLAMCCSCPVEKWRERNCYSDGSTFAAWADAGMAGDNKKSRELAEKVLRELQEALLTLAEEDGHER
jgi:hypothetical protein